MAGRPKGSTNHQSKMIKEMLFEALDKAGGADYLYNQSQSNPSAFMTMLGKILPTQIAGDEESPLTIIQRIERVVLDPNTTDKDS